MVEEGGGSAPPPQAPLPPHCELWVTSGQGPVRPWGGDEGDAGGPETVVRGQPCSGWGGRLVRSFGMQGHPESITEATSRPRPQGASKPVGAGFKNAGGSRPRGHRSPVRQSVPCWGAGGGFLIQPTGWSWRTPTGIRQVCVGGADPRAAASEAGGAPSTGNRVGVLAVPHLAHPGWGGGRSCPGGARPVLAGRAADGRAGTAWAGGPGEGVWACRCPQAAPHWASGGSGQGAAHSVLQAGVKSIESSCGGTTAHLEL